MYYAVIFTTERTDVDDGYEETAARMVELASGYDGFIGIESARSGTGITVSYWRDLESISRWHENAEHRAAQEAGYEKWYRSFKLRICRVEREYEWERE